jgi:hypothetical protein
MGPLKSLKFKDPGPESEKLFIKSFDTTLVHYTAAIQILRSKRTIILPDIDFDTGKKTEPGEYGLADLTYSELLQKLQDQKFLNLTYPLKQNILKFFEHPVIIEQAYVPKKDLVDWEKTLAALQEMKAALAIPIDSLKNSKGDYYKVNIAKGG